MHDVELFISAGSTEMFDCFRRRRITVEEAILDLRKVETTLHEMIKKYENIRLSTIAEFKACKAKRSKLVLLKKKKTLEHHIQQCENKVAVCVQKQYALEQLEVTKMQVEAIRSSTSVFRMFSKYNPIQKIEDLQSQMEDMTEDLADVTQLLTGSVMDDFDEEAGGGAFVMETQEETMEEEMIHMPEVPKEAPVSRIPVMV